MSLLFVLFTTLKISNAQLPGSTADGVVTVFNTVDIATTNNCEWEDTDPITDDTIFPFGNFAAVDTDFYEDAISCGECYELECISSIDSWGRCSCIDGAKVTVMIIDFGHDLTGYDHVFDLTQNTANNILNVDTSNGASDCNDGSKYNIKYTQVCCDHLQNIAVYNYDGMTDHWLSFIVTQVRGYGSITNLYFRENGRSQYTECQRNTNGINKNWICDPWTDDHDNYLAEGIADGVTFNTTQWGNDPPYQLPIDIKIIDSNNDMLESLDLITSFTVNQEFDFGDNFDAACDAVPNTTPGTETTMAVRTSTSMGSTTTMGDITTTPGDTTTTVDVTTTQNGEYVDCEGTPYDACEEAFDAGCCAKLDGECTNTYACLVPTTTVGILGSTAYSVNIKLLLIFSIILNILL